MKLVLKNDDFEFLKELQHELLTQEQDCQADPRYWGILEKGQEYGVMEDYADGAEFYSYIAAANYTLDELKEHLIEEELFDEEELNGVDIPEEMVGFLEEHNMEDEYSIKYFRNIERVSIQTSCFLTKRACKEHIRLNHYHYTKPQTYAMTAWRNPEFERLLNILKTIKFEEVICDEMER